MHSVHGDVVVVDSLFVERVVVKLKVVTLKDLIFIQREAVLHSNILDVLICLTFRNFMLFGVEHSALKSIYLSHVGRLADELVEKRDVLELLDLYLEHMLYLLVWLTRILIIGLVILVPVPSVTLVLAFFILVVLLTSVIAICLDVVYVSSAIGSSTFASTV